MTTLVLGGSKCGKSSFAENIFADFSGEKFYIATMIPSGEEARSVIERHQKNRAVKGFITIEKYTDIHEIALDSGCGILLECLGNLCANEMFRGEKIVDPTENILRGIQHLKSLANRFVIVSNDVSRDGIIYEKSTADYLEFLSKINQKIAEISDNVVECVFGIPLARKGAL